jgi:hypothetical protein
MLHVCGSLSFTDCLGERNMKKSLITTLVAAPLLTLSSMAFAAEPAAAEPVMLSAAQMDGVTAGGDLASLFQFNISPVTVVQISALNFGGGNNIADIVSGNLGHILQ